MTAFNIVRSASSRVIKSNSLRSNRRIKNPGLKGFRGGSLVKTGENTFCLIGEWASFHDAVPNRQRRLRG